MIARSRRAGRWALLLALCAGGPPVAAQTKADVPASPRVRIALNAGWRFTAEDVKGAESAGYDDAAWERVDLPHTWNATDALAKEREYRRGPGWYRRPLELPAGVEGKRVFLYFEGANQVADVWVNGRHVGRHVGGYTAFAFDVTALVTRERVNTLAVRVDNSHDPDIPPLSADFNFYGGLYRNVWLLVTDPLHLAVLDHAGPGVYVDAPELTAERAVVRVRGAVADDAGGRRTMRVVARLFSPGGEEVARTTVAVRGAAGGPAAFEAKLPAIASPRLWSPEEPNLYTLRADVMDGARLADRVEIPVGLRWYRYDAQTGFALNGKPYRLWGTNRHQDVRGLGNALPDALQRRDIALVKETGFNFLRLAHYPQAPAVLDEADRTGLALWEEIPVVNRIGLTPEFAANAERMLTEMVRQHYNHPSVFFWGYMNEVMLSPPKPLPDGYVGGVAALARGLNERAHAEDATRPTVMAVFANDTASALHEVPDILGLNLYFGWYYGELRDFGTYVDSLHARFPRRPLMISEYGAGGDERIHAVSPRPFDFSTEYEQRFHEGTFPQILARPWLLGSALWNQFDFGAWPREDADPTVNDKGLFYFDRRPKDVAYYYMARLRRDPVLHIATRDWPVRAGSIVNDREQPVVVYSNAEAVELRLDGRSLGVRAVENGRAEWRADLHAGENRLEARARLRGQELADATVVRYTDRTTLFRAATTGVRAEPSAPRRDESAATATAPVAEMAVNAGSTYHYTDRAEVTWEADRAYAPGSWGYIGGTPFGTHHRILATGDDPLLQTVLEGGRYRFDVPDGAWELELRFAETRQLPVGARRFGVRVNGVMVAEDIDLAAAPGPWTARTLVTRIDVGGGQGITIELPARAGAGIVSAIRLRRL